MTARCNETQGREGIRPGVRVRLQKLRWVVNKDPNEPNYFVIDTAIRRASARAEGVIHGAEVIQFQAGRTTRV